MPNTRIIGTGSYLPDEILTNADLEKMVDTTDEWIVTRTGIRERHIAADGQPVSDLAYRASLKAIEAAGIDKNTIDLSSDYHAGSYFPEHCVPVAGSPRFAW